MNSCSTSSDDDTGIAYANPDDISDRATRQRMRNISQDSVLGTGNLLTTRLKTLKSICTKKTLYKRLPVLTWLRSYDAKMAVGDLVAGITCGLTVIPQSLAYASIAGLPVQYGLYGSFVGCFVYIFLGTCKDVPMGPSAISSLLTFQAINGRGPAHAILLSLLSGVVAMLMALFGLGFIVDFVSEPVSAGFTSAVAVIIATSQVKDMLGVAATGSTFVEMWISIIANIEQTQYADVVLGVVCVLMLLLMRLLARAAPPSASVVSAVSSSVSSSSTTWRAWRKALSKCLWLIGTARNVILVLASALVTYAVSEYAPNGVPYKVIGHVPAGLPAVRLPAFHTDTESFIDMVATLGSGVVVVPLVALLEDVAICKAFELSAAVDATQELYAIGVSNIANAFVQGYPVTGALSRGALNHASGARTPFEGFYAGALVVFALLYLTPMFFYIPKATLAAIIIAAVVFMVEVKVVRTLWRSKKSDLVPGLGTFAACLVLRLELGILVGIALNLLFIVYHAARPKIYVETLHSPGGTAYAMITPDRCIMFPAADYVRALVSKHAIRAATPVVIDCSHVYGADYTSGGVVAALSDDFAQRRQPLMFYNLKASVCAIFEGHEAQRQRRLKVFYNEADVDTLLRETA